ncbi:MAG: hypothetical protein H6563_05915 [Lewinellaceae bacterium]|nr:hypothetical protein [Lewinellaceae bacterium]
MADLKFEVNLNGMFQVFNGAYSILTELPDGGGDIFPAPGPFDPTASNMIVQTDQPLKVKLHWRVRGALALLMAGSWDCSVYLEEMGPGEYAGSPYTQRVPLVAQLDHTYDVTVNVPPITKAGLFRVTVAVSLIGPPPTNSALPVAAFSDIGILRTYDAA